MSKDEKFRQLMSAIEKHSDECDSLASEINELHHQIDNTTIPSEKKKLQEKISVKKSKFDQDDKKERLARKELEDLMKN